MVLRNLRVLISLSHLQHPRCHLCRRPLHSRLSFSRKICSTIAQRATQNPKIGDVMSQVWRSVIIVVSLIFALGRVSSWGDPPPPPPPPTLVSDSSQNTAGGTDALQKNTTGFDNAAFGYGALYH